MDADLDADELEDLRQLAKKLSGIGLRAIDACSTAAQQKHDAQARGETRNRQHRRAPRPTAADPGAAADDAVAAGDGRAQRGHRQGRSRAMPPLRDIDGVTTRVRKLAIPDMHAFTQSEANTEETTDD